MKETEREQVADALETVAREQAASFRRGLYPRSFAIIMAVWTGVLTAAVAAGKPWTFLWMVAGIAGFVYWRYKRGIWVREINNRRDLWIAVIVGTVIVSTALAGIAGAASGLSWAGYVAGALVTLMIYALCEISYHHIWSPGPGDPQ